MPTFRYQEMLPLGPDTTPYRLLTTDGISTFQAQGQTFLCVEPKALTELARAATSDMAYLLRPSHLQQLSLILSDPEASPNDRFVALELLRNAVVASGRVLPQCQDTGTVIAVCHKGQHVYTGFDDAEALSKGIFDTYTKESLRYSQLAPLSLFEEVNTQTNLPAQIDIEAVPGHDYRFLFLAKGGGSANKTFLYQESKALLNPASFLRFVASKLHEIGTAACPPYHLAIVVGGTSAEAAVRISKLASTRYLDSLPTQGNPPGHALRVPELEEQILELTRAAGIGAQFGGKYFCHDVRVIRLPRHGASCPVALSVSCAADRQILGKITSEGVFLEQLETEPARYLPEVDDRQLAKDVVPVDLNQPMAELRALLSRYPVCTRLSLSGPLIVARDIAHAKLKERLDRGERLPDYFSDHVVYYAGPAKTPEGMASGSFGPTTAGRMDSYIPLFQAQGASLVTLAKGNRSKVVTESCQQHGGFYLGSIGGPAARLAKDCILGVEVIEYPELGMEAVFRIMVRDFPAFIVVDDKGHDFFEAVGTKHALPLLR